MLNQACWVLGRNLRNQLEPGRPVNNNTPFTLECKRDYFEHITLLIIWRVKVLTTLRQMQIHQRSSNFTRGPLYSKMLIHYKSTMYGRLMVGLEDK